MNVDELRLQDVEGIERRSLKNPSLIDFGAGTPPYNMLIPSLLRQGADISLNDEPDVPATFLQYGAACGSLRFRQALSNWLNSEYSAFQPLPENADVPGVPPVSKPEELFVTNGASQGLSLICRTFTRPGDVVLVEDVTYFLALNLLHSYGLVCIPVAADTKTGILVDDLAKKLVEYHPKMLYIIPTFQNPTGSTVPLAQRREIMRLCHENDCLLVADEVYQFLHFGKSGDVPPTPFWALPGSEKGVVSLQSFSKILAPGLRLGWLQSRDKDLLAKLEDDGVVMSGGGLNPFTAEVVRPLLIGSPAPLTTHLAKLREIYRTQAETMYSAMEKELPHAKFTKPRGGFFSWLTLENHWNEETKNQALKEGLVGFRAGIDCAVNNDKWKPDESVHRSMRMCFTHYNPDQLKHGIEQLARYFQ